MSYCNWYSFRQEFTEHEVPWNYTYQLWSLPIFWLLDLSTNNISLYQPTLQTKTLIKKKKNFNTKRCMHTPIVTIQFTICDIFKIEITEGEAVLRATKIESHLDIVSFKCLWYWKETFSWYMCKAASVMALDAPLPRIHALELSPHLRGTGPKDLLLLKRIWQK